MLFADFILEQVERHFGAEESLLLPALPDDDAGRQLAEHVREDHRSLREAATRLRHASAEPAIDDLHTLGARLRSHVQREERELFPRLEAELDEASLAALGARIVEALPQ